jgi:hypothetical protein
MDPMLIIGMFLVGGAGGYVLGAIKAGERLEPIIERLVEEIDGAKADCRELQVKLSACEREETQIQSLERMYGEQWP